MIVAIKTGSDSIEVYSHGISRIEKESSRFGTLRFIIIK